MTPSISQNRLQDLDCVLGLDCSKYQKDINWSSAKAAGLDFAFVKITEGTTGHEDSIYNVKSRIIAAQNAGIKIGYYHFARPGNVNEPEDDANEEVQNVLGHLGVLPQVTLPFVLDIEAYSSDLIWDNKIDHMNRFIGTFIDKMKVRNIPVIIYSYKSFLDDNTSHSFGLYPLWIAAYVKNVEVNLPVVPIGWTTWQIWQFTEKGQIDGYTGDLDLNVMKKDYFNQF
jgi:lysozyme